MIDPFEHLLSSFYATDRSIWRYSETYQYHFFLILSNLIPLPWRLFADTRHWKGLKLVSFLTLTSSKPATSQMISRTAEKLQKIVLKYAQGSVFFIMSKILSEKSMQPKIFDITFQRASPFFSLCGFNTTHLTTGIGLNYWSYK